MSELILGTAAFSPGYGISRDNLESSRKEGETLISMAQSLGISRFDTAPTYGSAEEILGGALDINKNPLISTKIGLKACNDEESLKASVATSLKKLRISQIDTLYIHDERALLDGNGKRLIQNLQKLQETGVFSKLGASIYSLDSLLEISERFPLVKVFQVPENICDRRLKESKTILYLSNENREFVVRSVFLQGLLLMKPKDIPGKLSEVSKAIKSLILFAEKNSVSVLDLCLAYARSISWCKGILVGVTTPLELIEVINSNSVLPKEWSYEILKIPQRSIDPRNWVLSR
jgi:aryl-alcohol dehydrogenase-like predicted oxidoreductase